MREKKFQDFVKAFQKTLRVNNKKKVHLITFMQCNYSEKKFSCEKSKIRYITFEEEKVRLI